VQCAKKNKKAIISNVKQYQHSTLWSNTTDNCKQAQKRRAIVGGIYQSIQ